MICPKCSSENIQSYANTSGKIKKRGCLMTLVHILLACATCGLWLIVPLLMGGSKGKIKTDVNFVCMNCGTKFNANGKITK
jgi:DNA-directed RNA polymerase subunit RPC12/RpoP